MLAIEVEFLMGRSVATRVDERAQAEWPPHPQRLFSALVAAHSELELGVRGQAALKWLERLSAPQIRADLEPSFRHALSHWVPVNDDVIRVEKGRADFRHPLERRNRQERFFPATVPVDPVVTFQWPHAAGLDSHAEVLTRMVEGICYLGHSASPVRACVRDQMIEPTLTPSQDGDRFLRVPGPGRFDRLESVHALRVQDESIQPPSGRLERYTDTVQRPETIFSPRALTLAFEGGPRLGLDSTLPLMQHLRNALLSRMSLPAPPVVAGHESDGRPARDPHIAFAPMGFVDSRYADGSLKGATLVLPRGIDEHIRLLLEAALSSSWSLKLGPLGSVGIRLIEDTNSELESLQVNAYVRPCDCWATVTPIILDRHPKKNGLRAETIIAESCRRVGLPQPTEVRMGSVAAFSGVPRAQDFHGQAKQVDGRDRTHALLRFATPVRGPLLLGAGRFVGLGVCRRFTGPGRA